MDHRTPSLWGAYHSGCATRKMIAAVVVVASKTIEHNHHGVLQQQELLPLIVVAAVAWSSIFCCGCVCNTLSIGFPSTHGQFIGTAQRALACFSSSSSHKFDLNISFHHTRNSLVVADLILTAIKACRGVTK
jgi:hypothetical protein